MVFCPVLLIFFVHIFFPLQFALTAICNMNLFYMHCGHVLKPNMYGYLHLSNMSSAVGVVVFIELFRYAISILTMMKLGSIVLFCWRIWQARNEELFQHKFVNLGFIFTQVQSFINEFHSSVLPPPLVPCLANSIEFWIKPSFPFLILEMDAQVVCS